MQEFVSVAWSERHRTTERKGQEQHPGPYATGYVAVLHFPWVLLSCSIKNRLSIDSVDWPSKTQTSNKAIPQQPKKPNWKQQPQPQSREDL